MDVNKMILEEVQALRKENADNHLRFNGRLRKLEVWRGRIAGAGAVLGSGVLSLLVKVFFLTLLLVSTVQGQPGPAPDSKFSDSTITLLNATPWRMFYSNVTSTAIQELIFGSSGQVLTSAGASAAPTWETPSGGGALTYFTEADDNDTSVFTASGGNTTVGFGDHLTMQGNDITGVGVVSGGTIQIVTDNDTTTISDTTWDFGARGGMKFADGDILIENIGSPGFGRLTLGNGELIIGANERVLVNGTSTWLVMDNGFVIDSFNYWLGRGLEADGDQLLVDSSGKALADAAGNVITSTYATQATTITAGDGLTGGGDLSANRTLTVGAGTGITVNANDVEATLGVDIALGEMQAASVDSSKIVDGGIAEEDLDVTNAGSNGQVLSKAGAQFTWIDDATGGGGGGNWTDSTGFLVGWGGVAKSVVNDTNYFRFEGSSEFDTTSGEVSIADDAIVPDHLVDSNVQAQGDFVMIAASNEFSFKTALQAGLFDTAGVVDTILKVLTEGGYLTAEVNNLETDGAVGIATTEIYIGTGAGTGAYAALSGDVTMDNAGDVTITSVDADVVLLNEIGDPTGNTTISLGSNSLTFSGGAVYMDSGYVDGILNADSIAVPLVIGGKGTTSDLTLQTTSGVGAPGADMHFLVGNNGAIEAMTVFNNGNIGIKVGADDSLSELAIARGTPVRTLSNAGDLLSIIGEETGTGAIRGARVVAERDNTVPVSEVTHGVSAFAHHYGSDSLTNTSQGLVGLRGQAGVKGGGAVIMSATGVQSHIDIVDGVASKIVRARSFHAQGIDPGSLGDVDSAYNFYGEAHIAGGTGELTHAYGAWYEKQTGGASINAGIVLNGDGAGSDIQFGATERVGISFDGTALNIGGLLYVDSSTGFVGIGDATPSYRFQVTSASTNSLPFVVFASDGSTLLSLQEDAGGDGRFDVRDAAANLKARIHSDGVSYFDGGNVAIGQTSAAEALDVLGNIAVSGTVDGVDVAALNTGVATDSVAWSDAYDHSQDNTQAHSDYLRNDVSDYMNGTLTINGLILGQGETFNFGGALVTGNAVTGFGFNNDIDVTGDIIVSGTVDGVDIAALAAEIDTLHFTFAILNPNATYDTDVRFCFKPVLPSAITITRIDVTCNAVPTTEPAMALKYADAFIGLANAVTIDVITTTNGVTTITSGFDDATVATGKALYLEFTADPEAALKSITVDVAYTVD